MRNSYNIVYSYIIFFCSLIAMRRIIYQHSEIQIVFKSDQGLKEQALEKARLEGITLKAMLTMAMRAYVNDELEVFLGKKLENSKKARLLINRK